MSKIRVLVVDDQKLFAKSLKVVLEGYSDNSIEVIAIAYDGDEAFQLVEQIRPDVVLMDVRMPNVDGVEATKNILTKFPGTKIMILTTFDDDEYVQHAIEYGAVGYILKNIEPEELITSVKAVYGGTFLLDPSISQRLLAGGTEGLADTALAADRAEVNFLLSHFPELSAREAEVLHMIAGNWDNREIAEALCIAEQTVKNYASRIYAKIDVSDRLHALQAVNKLN
jgi:DNA-binding NarL/FixJ family response regulator